MSKWRKQKEYVCLECKKDFNKLSQLKKHYKDAHRIAYTAPTKSKENKNERE